jgi:hypothetical protein
LIRLCELEIPQTTHKFAETRERLAIVPIKKMSVLFFVGNKQHDIKYRRYGKKGNS